MFEGGFCGGDRQYRRVNFIAGFQWGEKRLQKRNDEDKSDDQQKNKKGEIERQILFFRTFIFLTFTSSFLSRSILNTESNRMTTPMK